mmetsp:Transcript_82987/g.222592  ORF Transcript_82987/g.222592 Transcript_82987/m.222592 type:complete len:164 (+) Transcript_82987:129-620(+)
MANYADILTQGQRMAELGGSLKCSKLDTLMICPRKARKRELQESIPTSKRSPRFGSAYFSVSSGTCNHIIAKKARIVAQVCKDDAGKVRGPNPVILESCPSGDCERHRQLGSTQFSVQSDKATYPRSSDSLQKMEVHLVPFVKDFNDPFRDDWPHWNTHSCDH